MAGKAWMIAAVIAVSAVNGAIAAKAVLIFDNKEVIGSSNPHNGCVVRGADEQLFVVPCQ